MAVAAQKTGEEFRNTIMGLRGEMKKVIFGQDPALDALDRALKISFSGLRTKNKTAGAFLFMGPTGSGKTETAEQLAEKLGVPCKKIDCAEIQHSHEIAKLIGSPPGYLGHDSTVAILTDFYDQVKEARYGVLIFDEIEKADPALYQLLLGMMDKATVTDGKNRVLKFDNVIIILTSNIGEKDRKRASLGFGPRGLPHSKIDPEPATVEDIGKNARALAAMGPPKVATGHSGDSQTAFNAAMLRLVFSPEFMGRLDGVVNFADLSPDLIPLIANKFIAGLKEQAKANPNGAVNLEVTGSARDYIVKHGYAPERGARSILTFVNEAIVGRLAEELIAGALEGGGRAVVDTKEDPVTHQQELSFTFTQAAAPRHCEVTAAAATNDAGGSKIGDLMKAGHSHAGWIYAGISKTTHEPFYVAPKDSGDFPWKEAMTFAAKDGSRVPSQDELDQIYAARNKGALKGTFNVSSSDPASWYWSSSQYVDQYAWAQRFSDGLQYYHYKPSASSLRCVR